MADNIPEEGKGYKCKRPGCGGKFKHRTQLYRHKKQNVMHFHLPGSPRSKRLS